MYSSKLYSRKIISLFEKNGFRGSTVSIDRIRELRNHITDLHSQRILDETFFEERLNIFDFDVSDLLERAKSIIVATTIQPILEVEFRYEAKPYKVIVPPTYTGITDTRAYNLVKKILEPQGYWSAKVQLPEKLLLVLSGIGKYGKNNIVYVDGMGSFHRPVTFITDAELDEVEWRDFELHAQCIKCKACLKACPTGAISGNNFIIKAEKCLTYFNERVHSFPEWIDPQWHNCIIGCMVCQKICPINKKQLDNIDSTTVFSEQETLQILAGTSLTGLSENTVDKLKKIGLYDEYNILSRNLSVLLDRVN